MSTYRFPVFQDYRQSSNKGLDPYHNSTNYSNYYTHSSQGYGTGGPRQRRNRSSYKYHADAAASYTECMSRFQTHIETTLFRLHDLYIHNSRPEDAALLSAGSIEFQMQQNRFDRKAASFQLLKDFYERCALPHSDDALKPLVLWQSYLESHRRPTRKPSMGEIQYEKSLEESARNSASEFLMQYTSFFESRSAWLDRYIAKIKEREKSTRMELEIRALNAADQDMNNELTRQRDPDHFRSRSQTRVRTADGHDQSFSGNPDGGTYDNEDDDEHNIGHHEALENKRNRLKERMKGWFPWVKVRGEKSEDTCEVQALIDTGNTGPNVITRGFLRLLKLENIIEPPCANGDQRELTLADGSRFKPSGWIECMSFKFRNFTGWHYSSFWVTDEIPCSMIIGMPFLLKENIMLEDRDWPGIAAPIVSNARPKKNTTAASTPPEKNEAIERAKKRKEELENMKKTQAGPSTPQRRGINAVMPLRSTLDSAHRIVESSVCESMEIWNPAGSVGIWVDPSFSDLGFRNISEDTSSDGRGSPDDYPDIPVSSQENDAESVIFQLDPSSVDEVTRYTYSVVVSAAASTLTDPNTPPEKQPITDPQTFPGESTVNPQTWLERPTANPLTRPEAESTLKNQANAAGEWQLVTGKRKYSPKSHPRARRGW